MVIFSPLSPYEAIVNMTKLHITQKSLPFDVYYRTNKFVDCKRILKSFFPSWVDHSGHIVVFHFIQFTIHLFVFFCIFNHFSQLFFSPVEMLTQHWTGKPVCMCSLLSSMLILFDIILPKIMQMVAITVLKVAWCFFFWYNTLKFRSSNFIRNHTTILWSNKHFLTIDTFILLWWHWIR